MKESIPVVVGCLLAELPGGNADCLLLLFLGQTPQENHTAFPTNSIPQCFVTWRSLRSVLTA